MHRSPRAWLAALLLAYVALFGRSVGYALVWDDVSIKSNDRPLRQVLLQTQMQQMDDAFMGRADMLLDVDSYRPVANLTYWLDARLHGQLPAAMHAHNLLLGALVVLLAWALARRVVATEAGALGVAALFALHPLQVEPVAYVSARTDLIAALFALACALLLDLGRGRTVAARVGCGVGASLLFFLSVLSKEAYPLLPLALAGLSLARGRLRADLPGLAALLAVLPFYVVVRTLAMGGSGVGTASLSAPVLLLPGMSLQYLGAFFWPMNLSIERALDPSLLVPGWLALIAGAGAFAVALRRVPSLPVRLAAAGLAFAGLLLAPSVAGAIPTAAVADRYAYLPLWGMAVAGVAALEGAWSRPRLRLGLGALLGAWALLLLAISAVQVGVWRNSESLYERALAMEPGRSMAHYRVGYLRLLRGDAAGAAGALRKAVALDPANQRAHNNLGVAYLQQGLLDEAERSLQAALTASGGLNYRAFYNLSQVHLGRGDAARSCAMLRAALDLHPRYERAAAEWAVRCSGPAPEAP